MVRARGASGRQKMNASASSSTGETAPAPSRAPPEAVTNAPPAANVSGQQQAGDSEPVVKYIHVHLYKGTNLYGAWFNDPTIRGKKKRVYFGSHQTAYLAARAQDRAALKYKPHAADPSTIHLNFKEEDYAADEELRNMLTNEEFGNLLCRESRLSYTKMEPTPCLRQFYDDERANGNLIDDESKPIKVTLKEYLDSVIRKRDVKSGKKKSDKGIGAKNSAVPVPAVVVPAGRRRSGPRRAPIKTWGLRRPRTANKRVAPPATKIYTIGGVPLQPLQGNDVTPEENMEPGELAADAAAEPIRAGVDVRHRANRASASAFAPYAGQRRRKLPKATTTEPASSSAPKAAAELPNKKQTSNQTLQNPKTTHPAAPAALKAVVPSRKRKVDTAKPTDEPASAPHMKSVLPVKKRRVDSAEATDQVHSAPTTRSVEQWKKQQVQANVRISEPASARTPRKLVELLKKQTTGCKSKTTEPASAPASKAVLVLPHKRKVEAEKTTAQPAGERARAATTAGELRKNHSKNNKRTAKKATATDQPTSTPATKSGDQQSKKQKVEPAAAPATKSGEALIEGQTAKRASAPSKESVQRTGADEMQKNSKRYPIKWQFKKNISSTKTPEAANSANEAAGADAPEGEQEPEGSTRIEPATPARNDPGRADAPKGEKIPEPGSTSNEPAVPACEASGGASDPEGELVPPEGPAPNAPAVLSHLELVAVTVLEELHESLRVR